MFKRIVRFLKLQGKLWKLVSLKAAVKLTDGTEGFEYPAEDVQAIDNSIFKLKQEQGIYPYEGDRIKLTWLPYNNAYPNENVYTGSEGIVTELDTDGSFVLQMDTAKLIIVPKRGKKFAEYKFKKL